MGLDTLFCRSTVDGLGTHWIRNIDVLSEHFDVRAVDAPSYGESEQVDYGLTPQEYLQVFVASVNRIVEKDESFSIVGFSFGGACGSAVAAHFGVRVRAMTVIGPGGFSIKDRPRLDFIRYGDVKDDPLTAMPLSTISAADAQTS